MSGNNIPNNTPNDLTDQSPDSLQFDDFIINYLIVASDVSNIEQDDNEKVLINQYGENNFSLIAGKNGLAINTSREKAKNVQNIGLYVDDNALITGTLYACNLNILGHSLTDDNTERIIEQINKHQTPFIENGIIVYEREFDVSSYYFTHNLTLGNVDSSTGNRNPLHINRITGNQIDRLQFALRNGLENVETGDKSEILLGIIGDHYKAPGIIYTSQDKNLEFHISTSYHDINSLYNNFPNQNLPDYESSSYIPTMIIDTSGCLSINDITSKDIIYNLDDYTTIEGKTKLNVEGLAFIKDIITTDHETGSNLHLNDIYVKKHGLTIYAEQIYPGTFNGKFTFNSNVNIENVEINDSLTVHNQTNLNSIVNIYKNNSNLDRLSVFVPSFFNEDTVFDESVVKHTLNVEGTLQKDGCNLNVTEIETVLLNFDSNIIKKYIPEDSVYDKVLIASNIYNHLYSYGKSNLETYINSIEGLSNISTFINDLNTILYNSNYNYSTNPVNTEVTITNIIEDYISLYGLSNIHNYNIKGYTNLPLYQINDVSNLIINKIYQNNDIIDFVKNNLHDLSNVFTDNMIKDVHTTINTIYTNISTLDSNIEEYILEYGISNIENYLSNIYTSNVNIILNDINSFIEINYNLYSIDEISSNIYNDLYNGPIDISNINGMKTSLDNLYDLIIIDTNEIYKIETFNSDINGYIRTQGFKDIGNYISNNSNLLYDVSSDILVNYSISNINILIENVSIYDIDLLANDISNYLNKNGFKDIYDYVKTLNIKRDITDTIVLNLLTNYTKRGDTYTVLTYAVNDNINVDGNNINFSGRLGVGIDNDPYNSMITVYRRETNKKPEIEINDKIKEGNLRTNLGHYRGYLNKDFHTFCIGTNDIFENHNIGFYAGQTPSLSNGYSKNIPNLLITHTENNKGKIGINTKNPKKELDIVGDTLFQGNLYKTDENRDRQIINLLKNENDVIYMDDKRHDVVFNINKLEIDGGYINTTKGFYENDIRIIGLHKKTDGLYIKENVSIGLNSENTDIDNVALMVRNGYEYESKNNTVIRLLQSYDNYNNYDKYTGIDICRFTYDIDRKWYIYNIHDGTETFKIGYQIDNENKFDLLKSTRLNLIQNDEVSQYNDTYINNNITDKTTINGSLFVKGDINITGQYKINGLEITSNNISLSAFTDNREFSSEELELYENDISIQGKNIVSIVDTTGTFYIGEKSQNFVRYMNQHGVDLQHGNKLDSKLVIYDKSSDIPITSFNVYPDNENNYAESKIRLGVLPHIVRQDQGEKYWNLDSYSDIGFKKNEKSIGLSVKLYSENYDEDVFKIDKRHNSLHFSCGSDIKEVDSSFYHLYNNDTRDILHLENKNGISVLMETNSNNIWRLQSDYSFKISNNNTNVLTIDDNKFGFNVIKPEYTLDVSNINTGCMRLLNHYEKDPDEDILNEVEFKFSNLGEIDISHKINENQIIIQLNHDTYDLSKHDYKATSDGYLCNFMINYSNLEYKLIEEYEFSSNLYDVAFKDLEFTSFCIYQPIYVIDNINIFDVEINFNIPNVLQKYDPIEYTLDSTLLEASNILIYTCNSIKINYSYRSPFDFNIELIPSFTFDSVNNIENYNIDINIGTSNLGLFDSYHRTFTRDTDKISITQNFYITDDLNITLNNITLNGTYLLEKIFKLKLIDGLDDTIIYNSNILHYLDDKYSNIELKEYSFNNTYNVNIFNNDLSFNIPTSFYYENFEINEKKGKFNVYYKLAKSHIILDNLIEETNDKTKHHIYSYNGLFEIFVEEPNLNYHEIMRIDKYGEMSINSLRVNELKITGDIYDEYAEKLREKIEFDLNSIESSNNIYLNSDKEILVNTYNNYYDGNFIINRKKEGDNVLTIYNEDNPNSFIYIQNLDNDVYKIGSEREIFKIKYNDISVFEIKPDLNNNFEFTFNGKFKNEVSSIDIGDLHILDDSIINENENTSIVIEFKKNQSSVLKIEEHTTTLNGSLYCHTLHQISDKRIKEDISPITNALDKVSRLEGVIYKNILNDKRETGLIAQDVKKILPEVVTENDDRYMISYGNMMGLIIESIKELKSELDEIKCAYEIKK
tara:strand:+ start:5137 stop:11373 length:6237 start_codon:yes stop_codon:yes gene_type:complete